MNNTKAFQASTLQNLFNGVLRPNLVFFFLSNQGFEHLQLSHECNSQSGSVLGSHPFHFPPFVRMCFTPKHTLNLIVFCTSHLITNPMLGLQHGGTLVDMDSKDFYLLSNMVNEGLIGSTCSLLDLSLPSTC